MESEINKLDFLIIGAQKSATTTLYKYLSEHPNIVMPSSKEAPFFVEDNCQSAEWSKFSAVHFGSKKVDELWGKATPQYMAEPAAAQRIHRLFPNVKLIAILRDPIDRALSHYQMDQRRETEDRSFDSAIRATLRSERLQRARQTPPPMHTYGYESESDFYVAWGEYGRIIQSYLEYFQRSQILLLSMSELRHSPQGCLSKVLAFLDLDPKYVPVNLGIVSHRGGGRPIVSASARQSVRDNALFQMLWRHFPEKHKLVIRYWFDQRNVRKKPPTSKLNASTDRALRSHYAKDLDRLREVTGFEPDWLHDYRCAR